jgi:hypothetical protein
MIADASQKKKPPTLRNGPPADDRFKQSMADFSRRLGERVANRPTDDPVAAAATRRAALAAYDQARSRRLVIGLGAAAAVLLVTAAASFIPFGNLPPVASSVQPDSVALAPVAPELASPASLPAPPAPTPPVSSPPVATAPEPVAAPPAPAQSQPVPVESPPSPAALRRDEVREVQAKLRAFGFDPGPIDGVAGAMTEDAAMAYQRHRGHRQSGTVDRELLEELRQDPAPQVAPPQQTAQRSQRPPAAAPRQRRPADPMRDAGERFGRWLDSILR